MGDWSSQFSKKAFEPALKPPVSAGDATRSDLENILKHRAAGEAVRAEPAELEDAAGWLGLTAEPVEPAEGLRGRLLDRIDDEIGQEAWAAAAGAAAG